MEPHLNRSEVAQSVEQTAVSRPVGGSMPSLGAIDAMCATCGSVLPYTALQYDNMNGASCSPCKSQEEASRLKKEAFLDGPTTAQNKA